MLRIRVIALFIALCALPTSAGAQFPGPWHQPGPFNANPALAPTLWNGEPGYAGYPPIVHGVPFHRQDTQVWCWVAVAKMVAEHYARTPIPTQCEMLQAQYNAPCCTASQMCTRQGHESEIRALIASFGGRASTFQRPADGFALYGGLARGPIILHLTLPTSGHFAVATGMRVARTPNGPLGVVSIHDPYFGTLERTFPQLQQVWSGAILVL